MLSTTCDDMLSDTHTGCEICWDRGLNSVTYASAIADASHRATRTTNNQPLH